MTGKKTEEVDLREADILMWPKKSQLELEDEILKLKSYIESLEYRFDGLVFSGIQAVNNPNSDKLKQLKFQLQAATKEFDNIKGWNQLLNQKEGKGKVITENFPKIR